jgi:hypothetical protein
MYSMVQLYSVSFQIIGQNLARWKFCTIGLTDAQSKLNLTLGLAKLFDDLPSLDHALINHAPTISCHDNNATIQRGR